MPSSALHARSQSEDALNDELSTTHRRRSQAAHPFERGPAVLPQLGLAFLLFIVPLGS
ncbi:MAG: hypothetical protein ACJ8BW_36770 [Ktedonobacteraceae bacterium]